MAKNEKQGAVSAHHVRFILNKARIGHAGEIENIISVLQKAGIVAADEFSVSAATDPGARIPTADFDRALAGRPLDARMRAKVLAAAADLIA